MTTAEIAAALGAKPVGDGKWSGRCLAHEDKKASLSISIGEGGRTLIRCHANCATSDVVAAAGLQMADLMPERAERGSHREVAAYTYQDEAGQELFQVVRFEPKDFRQRRSDGDGGWTWKLGDARRVLYRLPQIVAGVDQLFIVEGEKDADALAKLGLVATCNAGGVGGGWREDYTAAIKGKIKSATIIADKDEPGRKHAAAVAKSLTGAGIENRIVEVPDGKGKDASDWIAAGAKKEDFERLAATPAAPTIALPFTTAEELANTQDAETVYLLQPYLVLGALTLLVGKVKEGKSTIALAMVQAVLSGAGFLGYPGGHSGPVIVLTEERPQSFRAALKRAGLLGRPDLYVLFWHKVSSVDWPDVVAGAVDLAAQIKATLLVVDTAAQWTGLAGDSENDAGAVLQAVKPLQKAAASGLCVLIVAHGRKSGGEVSDSARGSSALPGTADIVLNLKRGKGFKAEARKIEAIGRFDDLPGELVVEWTEGRYISRGNPLDAAKDKAAEALIKILPSDESAALPLKQLEELLKPAIRRTAIQGGLDSLATDQKVCRKGAGKPKDPYLYWARPPTPEKGLPSALPLSWGSLAEKPETPQSSGPSLPGTSWQTPADLADTSSPDLEEVPL